MHRLLRNVCLILCWLMAVSVSAQRIISGTVFDENKEPLTGATVSVKEKVTLGTTTDTQGKYMLKLPDNREYTLQVSYMGYISQTHKVSVSKTGKVDFILKEDAVNMETVVVTGTRTPKLLKDVPIVTRVITADEIKKVDATHIGDLLQAELPGIEFSYSMDQQVSLNMQGFGGNAVLFLVDGERLAGETLDNIDYNRLNMSNVERIEIVKGAASSLYGSNAVGGVVNIISKVPAEPWTVNLNGRYGAYNEQRYGGTIGFNVGKFNSVTNVQHTQVDEKDLADGKTNEETEDWAFKKVYGDKTWNFKERLVYTANDHLKLTARAGYFFREREKSQTSKDRYRDFSGGVKGNYVLDKDKDLEIAYSFDQYDKSDYLPQDANDVRDYSNVQHSVHTFYNHTFVGKHILTVGGDYMRDYLMSYQFANNGSKHQYTVDGFAQFDWNPTKYFNILGVQTDHTIHQCTVVITGLAVYVLFQTGERTEWLNVSIFQIVLTFCDITGVIRYWVSYVITRHCGNTKDCNRTCTFDINGFLITGSQAAVQIARITSVGRYLLHGDRHLFLCIGVVCHIGKQYQNFLSVQGKLLCNSKCHIRNQCTLNGRIGSCVDKHNGMAHGATFFQGITECKVIIIF